MTEAERDAFVEDKLACEHEKSLVRQENLLDATRKVLAQKDLNSLLQTAADAARELTGAKYASAGHGYVNGIFTAGGVSCSEGTMPCPPGETFNVEKGGTYLDLIQEKNSIRLTDAEMRFHPAWWGLPEGHVPLRGLLGARLVDVNGKPNGLMMVTDGRAKATSRLKMKRFCPSWPRLSLLHCSISRPGLSQRTRNAVWRR